MQHYASKEDTLKKLAELGFTGVDNTFGFLNSQKTIQISGKTIPVVQLRLYQCASGYWCIEHVPGGWKAPVVWNGPKADWDKIDPTEEFTDYLNEAAPGWR